MTEYDDISIEINSHRLNIRVVVLIETPDGFILEKDQREGFYVFVGGRVKVGETSLQAAKREVLEELNTTIRDFEQICVLENFFTLLGKKSHAYEFIYKAKTEKVKLPNNFYCKTISDIRASDIRPLILKDYLVKGIEQLPKHVINKDISYK